MENQPPPPPRPSRARITARAPPKTTCPCKNTHTCPHYPYPLNPICGTTALAKLMANPPTMEAVLNAKIAELESSAGSSSANAVSAAKEFKRVNKKHGTKVYHKACLGPPGCTKLMCDHSNRIKDKVATDKSTNDARIFDGLMAFCNKNGYAVSETYARRILEVNGGLMAKAWGAIKADIDRREHLLEYSGRLNIAFELEQSNIYNQAIKTTGDHMSNPALMYRRLLPTTRDDIITCIETEDAAVADAAQKGWDSIFAKSLVGNLQHYPTKQSRQKALNQYRNEGKFRSKRAEYYTEIERNVELTVDEIAKLMDEWDNANTQPRPAEKWAGSPFRMNHLEVVKIIDEYGAKAKAMPTTNQASNSTQNETKRAPHQATVEDASESDSEISNTEDPEVQADASEEQAQTAQPHEEKGEINTIVMANQAGDPYNRRSTHGHSHATHRQALKIEGQDPQEDDSITALKLLAMELMDKNRDLKMQNASLLFNQRKDLIFDTIGGIPEQDTWTLQDFLGELATTTFETWSYKFRSRGIRTINAGSLMIVISNLKDGADRILDLLMNNDRKVLAELHEFLATQTLVEYVNDIFEVDLDQMDEKCEDAIKYAFEIILDIDTRMLIMEAFNRNPVTTNYTVINQEKYDRLQNNIAGVLHTIIANYNGSLDSPELLESVYYAIDGDGYTSFTEWVIDDLFPIPEGDDPSNLMNKMNLGTWAGFLYMCRTITKAIYDRWPESVPEAEQTSSGLSDSYEEIILGLQTDEEALLFFESLIADQSNKERNMLLSLRMMQKEEFPKTKAFVLNFVTQTLDEDIQMVFGGGADALNDQKGKGLDKSIELNTPEWDQAANKLTCYYVGKLFDDEILQGTERQELAERLSTLSDEDREFIRSKLGHENQEDQEADQDEAVESDEADEGEAVEKQVVKPAQQRKRKVEMSLHKQLGHAKVEAKSKQTFGISFHQGVNNLLLESRLDSNYLQRNDFQERFNRMIDNPPRDEDDIPVPQHRHCTMVINAAGVKFPLCAHDHSQDRLVSCQHVNCDQPQHTQKGLRRFQLDILSTGFWESVDIEDRQNDEYLDENGNHREMSMNIYRQHRKNGNVDFDTEFAKLSFKLSGTTFMAFMHGPVSGSSRDPDPNMTDHAVVEGRGTPTHTLIVNPQEVERGQSSRKLPEPEVEEDEEFDYTISNPPVYDTRGNAIFTETVKLYEKLDAINRRIGRGRLAVEHPDDASIDHVCSSTGIKNKLWANIMIQICDNSAALAVAFYEEAEPIIMKYLEKSPYKANRAYCDAVGLEFGHHTHMSRINEDYIAAEHGLHGGSASAPGSSAPSSSAPKPPKVISQKAAKQAAKKAAKDSKGRAR